jgi:hypothetical protein
VTRRPLSRLNALLLIALMLCGGGGLPVVDALTHGYGSAAATGPHFETASAAEGHRDFCSLGAGLPLSPQLSTLYLDIAFGVVAFPGMSRPASAPRFAAPGLLPQPRAPPILSA